MSRPDSSSHVVLITGSLSDMGRAAAQAFAKAGYTIALNYRQHPEQAEALAIALQDQWQAPRAMTFQADVRSRQSVTALFNEVYTTLGSVDVLINNAGLNRDQPFADRARLEQDIPLARLGHPDEVAAMMLFLVNTGHYLTGQNFFVDGGLFMH